MAVKYVEHGKGNAVNEKTGEKWLVSPRKMPSLDAEADPADSVRANGEHVLDTIRHVASQPRTFDSWIEARQAWAREVVAGSLPPYTEQTVEDYADQFLRRATQIRSAIKRGDMGEAVYLAVKLGHLCGEFDTKSDWEDYVRKGFNNTDNGKRGGPGKHSKIIRNRAIKAEYDRISAALPKGARKKVEIAKEIARKAAFKKLETDGVAWPTNHNSILNAIDDVREWESKNRKK
jgi:hypothetical protein